MGQQILRQGFWIKLLRQVLSREPDTLSYLKYGVTLLFLSACFLYRVEACFKAKWALFHDPLQGSMNFSALETPTSTSWLKNSAGSNPNWHLNGDKTADELRKGLSASLTQTKNWLQEDGWWNVKQRRYFSSSWFPRSVWPFDWGRKPEKRLTEEPNRDQKALQ